MNGSIGFFDETARIGAEILKALGSTPATRQYLWHVARIYALMNKIHEDVAAATIEASEASTLDEARQALKRLDHGSLENRFRARNWCDRLQKLGQALRPLGQDSHLPKGDRKIWDEFCTALEHREGEVAMLYDLKLYDLRVLADGETSLASLASQAEEISSQLVLQKAQFDYLARKADAMHRRLLRESGRTR